MSVIGIVRAHGSDDDRDVNDDRGDHRAKAKSKNHVEPKWLQARDMVLVFCVASCLVWVCFGFHCDVTLMVVHRNLNLDIENGMNTSKP